MTMTLIFKDDEFSYPYLQDVYMVPINVHHLHELLFLPGKDPIVESVCRSCPQIVLVGDHLLHPLHPGVEAQDAGVGHGLHEVGILHRVPGVSESQTHT